MKQAIQIVNLLNNTSVGQLSPKRGLHTSYFVEKKLGQAPNLSLTKFPKLQLLDMVKFLPRFVDRELSPITNRLE